MSEQENSEYTASPKLIEGNDYYMEGGLMVLTADFLRKRGYCCGNGCRHCPYSEAEKRRQLEKKVI